MTIVLNGTLGLTAPGTETFGDGTAIGGATNPIVSMAKGANNYVQGYIVNNTDGVNASADLVAYPSNGTDSSGWVDMGVTGPTFSQAAFSVTGPNEAYLFGSAPSGASKTGNLVIATDSTGTANAIQFYTGGFNQAKSAARMVIDGSGNVGIGTSSPAYKLDVSPSTGDGTFQLKGGGSYLYLNSTSVGYSLLRGQDNGTTRWGIGQVGFGGVDGMAFYTGSSNTERARIDTSGNLLVGTTSGSGGGERLNVTGANANNIVRFVNSNASPYGLDIYYSGATPNGTGNEFGAFRDATATRFVFRSNGGIANYSANNINLSDARTKTDIVDAGGYLDKICAIPVRTFKYKDQTDDLLNLGVIAQEVEAVAPELVDVSGFGETPEDGVPLKAIYQTDLQYALMKCIQEQQALIESLKARLDAANL